MGVRPRSTRQERQQLTRDLRASNRTWSEIAVVFANTYQVNRRVAFRLARGWSQSQAADQWNKLWPAEPKTFKNFSYWELWPSRSGHTPSLEVLTRLAQLYQCRVADLLADCADFRPEDPQYQLRTQLNQLSTASADPDTESSSILVSAGETCSAQSPTMRLWSPGHLDVIMRRLHEMDVHELAETIAAFTDETRVDVGRRDLLLKLSAGLALAATNVGTAHAHTAEPSQVPLASASNMSGLWLSQYLYHSSGRDKELEGQHYVVFRQQGGQIDGQSLPHSTGSRLAMNLSVAGAVVTGTWTEETAPDGYYRGATYQGALQLLLSPTGREMSGKWLGFGKNFKVNSGGWKITWVDSAQSPRDLRPYHLKL
ncbi:hypothetical protein [Streptosporangium sp. NPDC002524]|uniref:hypothetical protein n=1 Tax=Streptosporangium sp. NPDC002524 TaxID=3154537 RepID=UPI00331E1491